MKQSLQKLKKENERLKVENELLRELLNNQKIEGVSLKKPKKYQSKYTKEID